MANPPSYSRFTITSVPDPQSGGFNIPEYERDMKAIVNQAVKSALSEGGYFKTDSRIVNKKTGETRVDVYVHSEDASVVSSSIDTELQKFFYRDNQGRPRDPRYSYNQGALTDREQKALAREEALKSEGNTETARFNKGTLMKIVGVLITIADITRRILSSVLTTSTQTVRDMVTAHNLGMSYASVRDYRHVERAHGLKEGTITEAVASEQQKYGNITSLDEKSLEYIALIMGSKVADMATMGLGASNPEAIVGAIVDRANELANAGYNSVGQYVGEQQARRELYSYLLKYSPQIADIFATMQEEQHNINSLFRNQADTFEEWKTLLPTVRGVTGAGENVTVTLGKEWDIVKDTLEQIKYAIAVSLAPELLKLLRRIADWRIGMTEEENEERNRENKEANDNFINSINATLGLMGDYDSLSTADKAKYDALVYFRERAEKANRNKRKVGYAVVTPDEIQAQTEKNLKNTGWTPEGQALDMSVITEEGMERVLSGNPQYDVESARRKYAELKRQVEAEREEVRKGEYQSAIAQWKKENTDDARISRARRNAEQNMTKTGLRAYRDANSVTEQNYFLNLLTAQELYGVDLFHKDGKELSLQEAIKYARDELGLVKSANHGYTLAPAKALPKLDLPYEDLNRQAIETAKNKVPDINPNFLEWLGAQDPYFFIPRLQELGIGAMIKEADKSPTRDWQVLFSDYGNNLSGLARVLPLGYNGSGSVYSVNERGEGGEIIHKIIMDINDNGKLEESDITLASWVDNRETFSGSSMRVTKEGDKISYTRESASEMAH